MQTARFVHWQDGSMWLGYFEDFPDYLTQGESLSELEESLSNLYRDVTGGEIFVRGSLGGAETGREACPTADASVQPKKSASPSSGY